MSQSKIAPRIAGLILAGGEGARMGGLDKGLVSLYEQPLVQHVLSRLTPQVDALWLNANRHLSEYQRLGYPVFRDEHPYKGHGPLSGVLSFIAHLPESITHIQLAPCDTPFLPHDLTERMYSQASQSSCNHQGTQSVYPITGDHAHYACALIARSDLWQALSLFAQQQFSLKYWLTHVKAQPCHGFSEVDFVNINTLAQLSGVSQTSPLQLPL